MFTSVAFIIITFFVYIFLPELRNLHGKCLMCYLISLAIGFSLMGWLLIKEIGSINHVLCLLVGYFMYFTFQVAFFWLNVICFDLWWNFRRTGGFIISERKRFMFYNIYAWGGSLLLTLLILLLDKTSMPEGFKPGVGNSCFLELGLPIFLYFYLPLFILCTLNIGFFTMAAIKIRQHQIEIRKVVSKDESRKHRKKLQKDKDNVTLFLRLFIVMGGGWIMEAISFVVDSKNPYFFLFDIWNASSGILIFICMVLKCRVLRLMKKNLLDTTESFNDQSQRLKTLSRTVPQ
ncbi:G-protein coupled receptor Mth2-like [Sitodiplosis mosellana]|uniref:G-protein coupled receptor Mth2-like n=1 Tax=Sitodiplosis mosellana TaxID=263140 RepID=UPI0024444687|nr:G-protein coupled receptor Mth2-like [Sitodiplosis mosellana]